MAEKLTRSALLTVVTMMAGTFLIILNQTLLSPVLPVLMADFSIDATVVQWLTSGYSLVMAVVIPLSPYLLGRFGSRRLFLASVLSFVVGSLAASLAPSFPVIMLGRVFQAIACGLTMPMAFTIVLLEFPRERRGSAMGLVMLVVGFAPAIGPTLSGILVETLGWRMLFVMVAVAALVVFLVALRSLGPGPAFEPTTFDKPSVALSTVGLVALLYGLSSFSKSSNLLLTIALIAGGALLMAVFAVRQFKLEVPLVKITVLKVGRFRATVTVNMINVAVSTGMSVMLPLFIQNLLGYSPFITGLTMLPGALAGAGVGLFAGKLFDRKGIRVCVVPGALLMTGALAAMALCFGAGTPLPVVGLLYGCMFVGLQLLNTTVGTWGLNALRNEDIQHAQATGNTLNQVAGSMVTAVVISMTAFGAGLAPAGDALAGLGMGYHLGFVTLLAVALVDFLVIMLFIRERSGQRAAGLQEAAEQGAAMGTQAGAAAGLARESELVSAVMNGEPYFVCEGSTLGEVAQVLVANKTSGVPVVSRSGVVVGFVSDGDLMKYLANEDRDLLDGSLMMAYRFGDPESFGQRARQLLELRVESVMTRDVVCVEQDMPLGRACQLLATKRIKKVPVVDAQGALVGTLSRSDVVRSTLAELVAIAS